MPIEQAVEVASPAFQALLQRQVAAAQDVLSLSYQIAKSLGKDPDELFEAQASSPGSRVSVQRSVTLDKTYNMRQQTPLAQSASAESPSQKACLKFAESPSQKARPRGGAVELPPRAAMEERSPSAADLKEPLLRTESAGVVTGLYNPGSVKGERAEEETKIGHSVFTRTMKLKGKVDTLEREEHFKMACLDDPNHVYKSTGLCQAIVQNPSWDLLTTVMVILSVIELGMETDNNTYQPTGSGWRHALTIADNIFCAFFLVELSFRFGAYRKKVTAWQDWTFLFDASLVLLMVWETWVNVILKLLYAGEAGSDTFGTTALSFRALRVLRVIRTQRMVGLFPELFVVFKGLFLGMKALFATLCALAFIIYVFGIAFTTMLSAADDLGGAFETLPKAMNFLFLASVCSIDKAFIGKMMNLGWFYWALWLLFVTFANMAILKMMTGVLVSIINQCTKQTEEEGAQLKLKKHLGEMFEAADKDNSGLVSLDEFDAALEEDLLIRNLLDAGVDIVAFVEFTRPNIPQEGLHVHEIVRAMLQFRGKQTATVKDIMEVRMLMGSYLQTVPKPEKAEGAPQFHKSSTL